MLYRGDAASLSDHYNVDDLGVQPGRSAYRHKKQRDGPAAVPFAVMGKNQVVVASYTSTAFLKIL
jgi:hypothetical protein